MPNPRDPFPDGPDFPTNVVGVGVSGGALLIGLADLDHHVSQLTHGSELAAVWTKAAADMRAALEPALEAHTELTGHRPWGAGR